MDDDIIQQGRLLLRPRKYAISFFVAGVLATPENDTDYQVSLRIADKEWNTGPPTLRKTKFNRYNVKPTETDGEFLAPYYNIADIGTVILYLKYKGKIGVETCLLAQFWMQDFSELESWSSLKALMQSPKQSLITSSCMRI